MASLVAWVRRLPRRSRRGPRRAAVHRSSDPGHWIVTFPWSGAERARTIADAALALGERNVSPVRTARLTGTQARLLERWRARIDEASATPPALDPRRRPADPDRLDQRDERQEHRHPADHPHPRPGRAARRDDDVGRRARRRAAHRARRLDRARRGAAHPGPRRTSTWPSSRRLAAGSSCAASATSRTRRASSPTSAPTTSTSRGSTPCPSWPRSRRRSAGSPGPTAGSSSTPTTRSSRRSPDGSAPGSPCSALDEIARPAVRRHVARGGRAYVVRRGTLVEVDDGQATPIVPIAEIPIAIGGIARHNVANALAAAGGARALGATIERGRRRAARLPAGQPIRSPGRLNLFRLGGRIVIVDFAHNEAGIDAVLDVAEGIAGGAAGPGRADHGHHRHGRRPPGRHPPRDRPDRGPARPARGDQGDPELPARAGPARRSSASCSPGWSRAAGRPTRSPSTRPRPRRSAPS